MCIPLFVLLDARKEAQLKKSKKAKSREVTNAEASLELLDLANVSGNLSDGGENRGGKSKNLGVNLGSEDQSESFSGGGESLGGGIEGLGDGDESLVIVLRALVEVRPWWC